MLLKRHYKLPDRWEAKRNVRDAAGKLADPAKPEGVLLNPPPLDHVVVRHTGTHAEQNFSTNLVECALAEGWMSIGGGKLVLDVKPEKLVYTIKRGPGHWCCHCGIRLPDAGHWAPGQEGRISIGMRHVAEAHPGQKSPDPNNPAGYCRLNHYECVLGEKAHAKFSAQAFYEQRKRARRG